MYMEYLKYKGLPLIKRFNVHNYANQYAMLVYYSNLQAKWNVTILQRKTLTQMVKTNFNKHTLQLNVEGCAFFIFFSSLYLAF
jgi:hypothetical protein